MQDGSGSRLLFLKLEEIDSLNRGVTPLTELGDYVHPFAASPLRVDGELSRRVRGEITYNGYLW